MTPKCFAGTAWPSTSFEADSAGILRAEVRHHLVTPKVEIDPLISERAAGFTAQVHRLCRKVSVLLKLFYRETRGETLGLLM
jgi:hypothetical protein